MGRYKRINVDGVTWELHRYVWTQAHGPIPAGMLIHHINHDPLDNRLENLAMLSPGDHSRHHNDKHPRIKKCEACGREYEPHATKRARSKTCSRECWIQLAKQRRGSQKGNAKLTEQQVSDIRQRLAAGEKQRALAREYQISEPAMHCIATRKTWTHVV